MNPRSSEKVRNWVERKGRSAWRAAALGLAFAAILSGCGGGVDSGGTGNGIYASGPITGYGSTIVGGIHCDDSAAIVQDDDGTPRTAADLQLGMVTEIQATAPMGSASRPTATALAVHYRCEIIGRVTSVCPTSNSVRVLGQTVSIAARTVFDARLAGGLANLKVATCSRSTPNSTLRPGAARPPASSPGRPTTACSSCAAS